MDRGAIRHPSLFTSASVSRRAKLSHVETPNLPPELIEAVRQERDPIRRISVAGDLIVRLQQGEVELSRVRREAMEEAASAGMSYSEIARQVGLTRGRISQIRTSGPRIERAFFGIGPIELAVPFRHLPGRELPLVAAEDLRARDELASILDGLGFNLELSGIDPENAWKPKMPDLIAICGPKSSPHMANVLDQDPALMFAETDGRWAIQDRSTKHRYESPMDDDEPAQTDVAYLARLPFDDERSMLSIAGIHAIGSLGVIHYLQTHLGWLYDRVGLAHFSMVIRSEHQDDNIVRSEAACDPILH